MFFFSSGILVSIPFALFFSQFYTLFPAALAVVILAPFIEELGKGFPTILQTWGNREIICYLGRFDWVGFWYFRVCFVRFLFRSFSYVARFPGIIFHSSSAAITAYGIAKKESLALLPACRVPSYSQQLFSSLQETSFRDICELLVLISVYLLAWRYYHKASKDKMVV